MLLKKRQVQDQIDLLVLRELKRMKEERRGGSTVGRRYINRRSDEAYELLMNDYFRGDNSTFSGIEFRRRFRMEEHVFCKIVKAVTKHDDYFKRKKNAAGKMGFYPAQKVTAALRQLCYGISPVAVDEYLKIGESTALESLKRFCVAIVEVFEEEYLRRPNEADVKRLLKINENRGFPGMLGSVDCMHWTWKNCPTAFHGQFTGKEKVPTIILEAVASYDLWIWHAFFGLPGSLNDINVLDRSDLFQQYTENTGPEVKFTLQNEEFNMGYYLGDGIYPNYANIVKTIAHPRPGAEAVNNNDINKLRHN